MFECPLWIADTLGRLAAVDSAVMEGRYLTALPSERIDKRIRDPAAYVIGNDETIDSAFFGKKFF